MKKILLGMLLLSYCIYSQEIAKIENLDIFFTKQKKEIKNEISKYESYLNEKNYEKVSLVLGVLYCSLAIADEKDKSTVKSANKYLKIYNKKDKKNDLANAYLAMSYLLLARDGKNPVMRMMNAKKGFKIYEKAVNNSSKDNKDILWKIRFLRANNYIDLPSFFKKRDIALDDYNYVEKVYNKNNGVFEKSRMIGVYYHLGEGEKSNGNIKKAIEYWNKSIEIDKEFNIESKEAKEAKKQLKLFQ